MEDKFKPIELDLGFIKGTALEKPYVIIDPESKIKKGEELKKQCNDVVAKSPV